MTGVAQVDQSQQIAESELQDQIAGAGAEPSYLVADNLPLENLDGADSASLSGPGLASTAANSALTTGAPVQADEEAYLENTSKYENALFSQNVSTDDDIAKLQNGSDKIDGDNPDIEDLVNDILEEAGLSEKPEGMTDEEYQQAIAEAIYNWLQENWEYAQDLGDDYWQSVMESLGLSGDCEDFAIMLASMLIAAGLNPEDVAVIVDAEGDHAYVAIEINGEVFILDNGEMQETDYASLDQLLADDSKVGAWFKQGSYGINNADLDIDTAGDTSGTSGGGGTNGDALDAINNLDNILSDSVLGFDEEDFYSENSDGYQEVDAEKLEKWEQWVLARANALAALLMMISSQGECKKLVDENFTGVPIEAAKHSYKEAYARKISFLQKVVRVAISKLFERVNILNNERYEKKMKQIKKKTKSSPHTTENLFCGGSADIRETKRALNESADYLKSSKTTLEAMQSAIRTMLQFLVATAASDDFSTLAIVAQLKKFNDKIDAMNKDVDQKLADVMDKIEDLPSHKAVGVFGFALSFFGQFITIGIWTLITNCSDKYDIVSADAYMEKGDITSLIDEHRGIMMVLQNAQRGALSLKMHKRDLRNVIREQFTGLTGVSGDAEIVMRSVEGMLGHTMQVFDATASQLMLKISLHNRAVQLTEDLQQLHKAAPLRALSFAASLGALVGSVIATIYSGGKAARLIVAVLAAIVAVAKAITDWAANKIANSLEGYDPPEPEFNEPVKVAGPGGTVVDVINNIEIEQQANMAAAAYNNSMGKTDDGSYYFDSASFALYEVKQKMFDNLIRMFFSMIKNGKDLKRVVSAEMTGTSAADSGEALLQNAVENVLMQKQLILSAIKFQLQEVVNAKNIDKQRELAEGEAGKGLGVSLGGAGVGGIIGAFCGGPQGAALGVSIGSAVASSLYQFLVALKKANYNWNISPDKAKALRDYLQSSGNASTEAKLDAAELQAYENLLNNGIISSGDEYFAVDFGLVTQTTSYLGRIYAAKEALAKAKALGSELRAIVKQEMSGVTLAKSGALIKAVNQADFSTAMKVLGALVSFMNTKAQIKNRGVDARKQLALASINLGVSVAASVTGFSCSAAAKAGNAAAGIVANMMPAVMSLCNSLTSMIAALTKVNKAALGAYTNYDAKAEVDKTGTKVKNAQTIDAKLAQMEYDIMLQMNSSMINSLTGGYEAVSSDAYNLSAEMKGVHNMKEALAVVRSVTSAVRDQVKSQMTGKRQGEVTFGKETIENYKQVALSTLDSLKSALDTIAQRHNQSNAAVRQAIFSGIQAGFSAASIVCSSVAARKVAVQAAVKSGEDGRLIKIDPADAKADAGSGSVGTTGAGPGGSTGATSVEMNQASQATQAKAEQNVSAGKKSKPGTNSFDRSKSIAKWQKAASACQMAGTAVNVIGSLIQMIIDDTSHEEASTTTVKDSQRAKSGDGKSNAFSNMDKSDADIRSAEANISAYQYDAQAYSFLAQSHEQFLNAMVSLATSIPNHVQQMQTIDDRMARIDAAQEVDKLVMQGGSAPAAAKGIAEGVNAGRFDADTVVQALVNMQDTPRAAQILTSLRSEQIDDPVAQATFAAALTTMIQPPLEAAPVTPTEAQATTPSTRAYCEALDAKIAQGQAKMEEAAAERAQLQQQVQGLDTDAAKLEQKVDKADLDAQVQSVSGQIAEAKSADDVVKLEALLKKLEAQNKSLQAEQKGLIARKGELQARIKAFDAKLASYESATQSDIQKINSRGKKIQAEIDQIIADEGLSAEEAEKDPRIKNLRADLKMLQSRRESFEQILKSKVYQQQEEQPLKAELEQVDQRLKAIKAELSQTNKDINAVKKALSDKSAQLTEKSKTASVHSTGAGASGAVVNEFAADYRKKADKRALADLENVSNDSPEAGEVVKEPALVLAAFGAKPPTEMERITGLVNRSIEEENMYSTAGTGVSA